MSRNFILLIGPSGSGKGTMLSLLKERHSEVFFPVSATTRAPRPGEKEGETYYFLSKKDFQQKIKEDAFLEYACVHGENYYGTLIKPIKEALDAGKIVVREIDYQGFLSVQKTELAPYMRSIFILPPLESVLRKRIQERAPITEEELDARMESMKKELAVANDCDTQLQLVDGNIEGSYKLFEEEILKSV